MRKAPYVWFSLAVLALMIGKVLLARWMTLGHVGGTGVAGDLLLLLAAVALASALPPRASRWTLLLIDAVVSFLLFATVIYTRYFDQVPSLLIFTVVGQLGDAADSTGEMLRLSDLLFVIDLPVIAAFAARRSLPDVSARVRRAAAILGVVALAGTIAVATLASRLPQPVDGRAVAYRWGVLMYEVSTLIPQPAASAQYAAVGGSSDLQRRIDELSRRQWLGRVPGAPERGSFAGVNVIVVQVEALQTGLLGARVNGQPVMPNLERFAARSWYFPNTIAQIGKANTADAEFVANTSLYPAIESPTPVAYGEKEIPSLPRLLAARGYDTFTMHTNDVRFWNRIQLYPALGFDRYYDDDFFGRADVTGYGASDRVLFDKALPELERAAAAGPFYAQLVTLSGHHPFEGVAERSTLRLPADVAETETGRYLKAQSYVDDEIGRFFVGLERAGLLENSIVVVYGDHWGMKLPAASEVERHLRESLYGRPYNRADFYSVPLLVHVPGQTRGRVENTALGFVDIMPTVADLVDLDLGSVIHFGRSAFERTPTLLTKGGAIDLYADDDIIYMAGLTDSENLAFSTRTKEPTTPVEPDDMANVAKLFVLSALYVDSLPARAGATESGGFVPTRPTVPSP
ncbi:MAG: LTA synthase family protein [Coriobacteriia bacterium]|nr:LTA synthase family protein [Coriobacteriia bacterium]